MQTGNEQPASLRMTSSSQFTREGKFVMASARVADRQQCYRSLRGATSVRVYARETKCSSARYGQRVMVYDADTGSSTHWARTQQPLDMDQRPSRTSKPNELCPMVCGYGRRISNFHCRRHQFRAMGSPYVADAGTSGSSVHAEAIRRRAVSSASTEVSLQARSVAFSPDPASDSVRLRVPTSTY